MGFADAFAVPRRPPTCSASTRRCRASRTTAARDFDIGAPRGADRMRNTTRSSRCNGRRGASARARHALLRRRRLLHARPQGALRRARGAGAEGQPLSERFPFRLNTGRVRDQWHTMTRTGMSPRLGAHLPGAVRRGASGRCGAQLGLDRRRLCARCDRARRRACSRSWSTRASGGLAVRADPLERRDRLGRARRAIWSRRTPTRSPASRRPRRRRPRLRRSHSLSRFRADAPAASRCRPAPGGRASRSPAATGYRVATNDAPTTWRERAQRSVR